MLPNYLRFIKGVVDCEDLPLNISRENYQDSSMMNKLRNVLTRRTLKMLEEESKKDINRFDLWYKDFGNFLKEGVTQDNENQQQLIKLMRFSSTFQSGSCSLDDYVKGMKPEQKKIFFLVSSAEQNPINSPFIGPFKSRDLPVLFVTNNIDEMIFKQMQEYKGFKFINIETNQDEALSGLAPTEQEEAMSNQMSIKDQKSICNWFKDMAQEKVSKVIISKRLTDVPAVITGPMSASMRMIMSMMQGKEGNMDQDQLFKQVYKDNVLEINAGHPLILKLNDLRMKDVKEANVVGN